jgi:general secretion pathway protein G
LSASTEGGHARVTQKRRHESGFTLIELITVMAILSVLVAVALPQYKVVILQAKEAVLKENLVRMRDVIDQFQADKGRYPESLDELVDKGYLRALPVDPMTGWPGWQPVMEEMDPDNPSDTVGIFDLKSTSGAVSLSGTPYNEW